MRIAAALLVVLASASAFSQTGWGRYRVTASTAAEAQRISDCPLGLFSESVKLGETDLIVGPGELVEIAKLRLPAQFIGELPNPENWASTHGSPLDDYQSQYLRYDAIIAQYETWRLANSRWIKRTQVGTTVNGRAIWAYRFYSNTSLVGQTPVRSVVINCGIHAREWISPAVGMYIMNNLITSAQTRDVFQRQIPWGTEFYIVPVMNADGYEYCWTNNRMWRKNRRPNSGGSFGVDLNRNFSKGWGLAGSSGSPSSDTYRGPAAFSEPETNGLRNYLSSIKPVAAFVDFHSYGQYVLWPWGYTENLAPGDPWLRSTGMLMKQSLQDASGMNWTAGPTGTALYIASGVSPDYFYDRFNSPAYTIELRDTGQFGFILPESQILPAQVEAWAAFKTLVRNMLVR